MEQAQRVGERYDLHPRQPWTAALAATRRLVQLQPHSAATHCRLANLLRDSGAPLAEVLAASEAALRMAELERSYSLVASAMSTAEYQVAGVPGRTWRLADVQPLVATAERAVKLCRRWPQRSHVDSLAGGLSRLQAAVQQAASRAGASQAAMRSLRGGTADVVADTRGHSHMRRVWQTCAVRKTLQRVSRCSLLLNRLPAQPLAAAQGRVPAADRAAGCTGGRADLTEQPAGTGAAARRLACRLL